MSIMRITQTDFEKIFGFLGNFTDKLLANGIQLEVLKKDELESAFLMHKQLMNRTLEVSGPARKKSWQDGWEENLIELQARKKHSLIPKYFGKFPYIRFNQHFFGADKNTELRFLYCILLNEIESVIKNFIPHRIIEFGCGTGHNLFFLSSYFPNLNFLGTDWAKSSAKIVELALKHFGVHNVTSGFTFDYFNPNYNFDLNQNDLVITVASLEQVGETHKPFLDYLISKKPKRVLNIEPESSLLDFNNKVDKTSIDYMSKRGYLSGFLNELKSREAQGQIRILKCQRSYLGSFPMDGYSVFLWEPVHEL